MIVIGDDHLAGGFTDRREAHDFLRHFSGLVSVGDQAGLTIQQAHKAIEEQARAERR